MTYFEVGFQKYLHNKILQHFFDSNLKIFNFQMKYFENISNYTITQASKYGSFNLICTFIHLVYLWLSIPL